MHPYVGRAQKRNAEINDWSKVLLHQSRSSRPRNRRATLTWTLSVSALDLGCLSSPGNLRRSWPFCCLTRFAYISRYEAELLLRPSLNEKHLLKKRQVKVYCSGLRRTNAHAQSVCCYATITASCVCRCRVSCPAASFCAHFVRLL